MKRHLSLVGLILLTSGCITNDVLTASQYQRLTLCNAGSTRTVSAELEAKIAEDLRDGRIETSLSNEIKGLFMNDPNLASDQKVAAYERYIACLNEVRVEN